MMVCRWWWAILIGSCWATWRWLVGGDGLFWLALVERLGDDDWSVVMGYFDWPLLSDWERMVSQWWCRAILIGFCWVTGRWEMMVSRWCMQLWRWCLPLCTKLIYNSIAPVRSFFWYFSLICYDYVWQNGRRCQRVLALNTFWTGGNIEGMGSSRVCAWRLCVDGFRGLDFGGGLHGRRVWKCVCACGRVRSSWGDPSRLTGL